MASDGAYKLSVRWEQTPGWRKPPIEANGPHEIIAAILKELCSSPTFSLTGLASIEVKRDAS